MTLTAWRVYGPRNTVIASLLPGIVTSVPAATSPRTPTDAPTADASRKTGRRAPTSVRVLLVAWCWDTSAGSDVRVACQGVTYTSTSTSRSPTPPRSARPI